MDDLDSQLAAVAALPADPRLDALDRVVAQALTRRGAGGRVPVAGLALAAVLAFGSGITGTALLSAPRTPSLFPLGAPAALAPSVLLERTR